MSKVNGLNQDEQEAKGEALMASGMSAEDAHELLSIGEPTNPAKAGGSDLAMWGHTPGALDEIWIIDIGGYGSFAFRGDEEDCQHLCAGKAQWEGGRGSKWLAKDIDLSSAGTRPRKTLHALIHAVKYPNGVADSSNYGPHPNKAARAVGGSLATAPDAGQAESVKTNG